MEHHGDESVTAARRANQRGGGGSIPASSLFFYPEERDEANVLVKRFHYSHRIPSNIQFVGTLWTGGGMFGTKGDCVAACFFSIPPTRWSRPVWELSRLVRRDDANVPLSFLIGLTVRFVRRKKMTDLIVSFADRTHGHHGGIYQACGWKYSGVRDCACDGVTIDGSFYPGRTCNSSFGTRSPDKLRCLMPSKTIEPHYDEGKHLYWLPLNKQGTAWADELDLKSIQYPKGNG